MEGGGEVDVGGGAGVGSAGGDCGGGDEEVELEEAGGAGESEV